MPFFALLKKNRVFSLRRFDIKLDTELKRGNVVSEVESQLLSGVEIVQVATPRSAQVVRRAIEFSGQMARQMGAIVAVDENYPIDESFLRRGKQRLSQSLSSWLAADEMRLVLLAAADDDDVSSFDEHEHGMVVLCADALDGEATLFAASGLADLLGDPSREPLIPRGDYAAGTAAYAVIAALAGLVAKMRRGGGADIARVDAAGVLSWVNWKAAAAGSLGRDIHRQGDAAEWPVIPCADGYAALVYQERDWPRIIDMVADERLADSRFASFKGREQHRDEYMAVIRGWAAQLTKAEILQAFLDFDIPAAPVMMPRDLLNDPLLAHRGAFARVDDASGSVLQTPKLAHRVPHHNPQLFQMGTTDDGLPLSGLRVLDLGIITAGAGVSALLADLGAEVLKVESFTYPDPFRAWAGQEVSPLFKCNNRNKYGIALDLKDANDKAKFLQLVKKADVVVENFRRGVLERLGLGYDVLRSVNPGIMLASISGQGLTGPGSGASSFGSTLEASSGFSANVAYDDGVPYITGRNVNYPDQTVVLYAAAVITAALSRPERGMHLDVSQRDVAVYLLGEEIERVSSVGPGEARDNGHSYKCADGHWVAFDDAGPLPVARHALMDWVAQRSTEQVLKELAGGGVGAAQVLVGTTMYALRKDSDYDVFAHSPDGALVKGFPFQFVNSPMTIKLDSPDVGEHNAEFVE